ncbi:hypothetical protein B4U79_04263 [Dinothrombium tinctorium]|uniref:Transglutaminase-like domain-containing protein n=1 Tax=Dinothrombium tinctorium TaxID=1965070 RepID=A0A3S3SJM0_9ACAR|nr:hypothetical protein B4U79_04263 [Dinothrombium tinctorium]
MCKEILRRIKHVEFNPENNAKAHHTSDFDAVYDGDLIIRRGQPFVLQVEISEPFDETKHDIYLQFGFGPRPSAEDNSFVSLKLRHNENFMREKSGWDINLFRVKDNVLEMRIFSPATIPVGKWKLLLILSEKGQRRRTYRMKKNIYILFNPWDEVYFPDESALKEYVLNDIGKIHMGTFKSRDAREWLYGQGNSNDDDGLVVGKWEEPYKPGRAPWEWMGSAIILQQYHQTNGTPVKYGQCWVFAGVITTICRALGMPTRTITNYRSAHDTNNNLRIERYYNKTGELNSDLSRDSIWNFHVWNEVWMKRFDLPEKYSGWQVIDSTPQEISSGYYRTGPAPVSAIKEGEINIGFDGPFIYSEVNADLEDFLIDDDGKINKQIPETNYIGGQILTKSVRGHRNIFHPSNDEDLTYTYKYPEGTLEERRSFINASSILGIDTEPDILTRKKKPMEVELKSKTENDTYLGEPIIIRHELRNKNFKFNRTLSVGVNVTSEFYNSMKGKTIKQFEDVIILAPEETKMLEFTIPVEEYADKLVTFSMLRIMFFAKIEELQEDNLLNSVQNFKLINPELELSLNGVAVKAKTPFDLSIRFSNPLPKVLTECKLTIEGRNFGPKDIPIKDIRARETISHLEQNIRLRKPGEEHFTSNLNCKELNNILGNIDFKQHKTDLYEIGSDDLILRRGFPFTLKLQLSEHFIPTQQEIVLQFLFGKTQRFDSDSLAILKLKRNNRFMLKRNVWDSNIVSINNADIEAQIYAPATVAVGVWNLRVLITQNGYTRSYRVTNNFYILFNPWSKYDSVYMPSDSMKQEYVLNDVGKIYMGTYGSPEAREWLYGQFRLGVLPAVMFILQKSGLNPSERANAIQVSSMLSALTNSHDENGVVYGKWEKPYEPYKAPWEWTGSASILQMYYESNGKPVRYGQCWVYAAVLTTICRALGLPARPVTNYASAHDTNKDIAIERYFDGQGEVNPHLSRDSIWNFHVWTEVWMARDDLQTGYNGWQVIDATPQEPSDGIYRTGPVPVRAIKNGDVKILYDGPFVYAEVNADVKDYSYDNKTGQYKALKTKQSTVGRQIITKRMGYTNFNSILADAEDITLTYKFREGTREERESYNRALSELGLRMFYAARPPPASVRPPGEADFPLLLDDVSMLSSTADEWPVGRPFEVIINLVNNGVSKRTVVLSVNVSSSFYTGNISLAITERKERLVLAPHENLTFAFIVAPEDYVGKLEDFSILKVIAFAKVEETNQILNDIHDIKLINPGLRLTAEQNVRSKQPFNFVIEFVNPLRKTLRNCKFNIESRNYGPKEILVRDIAANEHFTHLEKAVILKPGLEMFIVNFVCQFVSDTASDDDKE